MKITLSWLKEHLNFKAGIDKLTSTLTDIGLEVESVQKVGGEKNNFKIAKIIKAIKHPNADKLKLCDVKITNNKIVKVVCGANNAREGLFTVYAGPGAVIPKTNFELKVAKIRGVESFGMLCSESELNLSAESAGIIELKANDAQIGKDYFNKKTEEVIDISITPNRPDCLGVRGIARDLAATKIGSLKVSKKFKLNNKFKQPIKISILKEKNQGCATFGACYIKNIKNTESPQWLKDRVISLGLRPISAVVDITNYVMYDLNRPLHAYDADKIDQEIIVRNSKKGESLSALDNKKYNLDGEMCVIADRSGPLGLGGIIGGTRSGTELETKNVLLESAYFYPSSIRKTATKLKIDTDAKYRFERGIDPNSIVDGLELGAYLIKQICGGEISKFSTTGKNSFAKHSIKVSKDKFKDTIGFNLNNSEITKILNSLGFETKFKKDSFLVTVPTWRPDIEKDIDIIEELIRIKGYDQIPLIYPEKTRLQDTLNFSQKLFHFSQRAAANRGYLETVTWSFTDSKVDKLFSAGEKEIKITNPISTDLDVVRRSIFSNLAIYLKKNQDRGFSDIALFEVGPVFFGKNPGEQLTVVGGLRSGDVGKKNWLVKSRKVDAFDVKADVLFILQSLGVQEQDLHISSQSKACYHPGRSGAIQLHSKEGPFLAYFGELHPSIISRLDFKEKSISGFEIFLKNIKQPKQKDYLSKSNYSVSEYQKSERDFAFVIDKQFSAADLEKIIYMVDKDLIRKVTAFDLFEGSNLGENKKSLALSVVIQSFSRTLTEKDLDSLSKKIIQTVQQKTGATIRS